MGIKTLELDPTRQNIYDTLIKDAVGRNKYLWQFASFCSAQESRCSIALDAGWGMGKTFFLKHLEMLFNCFDLKEDEQKEIINIFSTFKKNSGNITVLKPHVCIYYDAWLNDNADDPMQSILYCLIKHKSDQFLKQTKLNKEIRSRISIFVNNSKELARKVCHFNLKEDLLFSLVAPLESLLKVGTGRIADSVKALNPTREIDVQNNFHDAFNDFLNSLIPNADERLLILIDELDRCKPTYAVQLLERIKHYLSNDRITFVFTINEEQLLHTIKAFYGEGFDAYQYLDRFFEYRLSLPKPDMNRFNSFYGFDQSVEQTRLYKDVCDTFIQEYSLSLREATKYRQWVEIVCSAFLKQRAEINDNSWKVVMFIIIPVMLGLKIKDKNLFSEFVIGHHPDQTPDPLINIVNGCQTAKDFLSHLKPSGYANINGTLQWNDSQNPTNCISSIYKLLFVSRHLWKKHAFECGFNYNEKMRDTVFLAPTLMDDFITFDTNTEETAHG